jgi:hypothetical protein
MGGHKVNTAVRRVTTTSLTLLFLAIAAAVVWSLVGQGRSPAQPRSAAMTQQVASNPRAQLQGPKLPALLPGEVRDQAVGADMFVPTAEQAKAAQISSASAVDRAKAAAPLPEMVTDHATGTLMMYSNTLGTVSADGRMSPSVPTTLSWVVTFDESAPLVVPPANFHGTLPTLSCQYVVAVNAITGAQLDAYQMCKPSA